MIYASRKPSTSTKPTARPSSVSSTTSPQTPRASSSRACASSTSGGRDGIARPVAHKPLALADWRTLNAADLVSVDLVYPRRTAGIYCLGLCWSSLKIVLGFSYHASG